MYDGLASHPGCVIDKLIAPSLHHCSLMKVYPAHSNASDLLILEQYLYENVKKVNTKTTFGSFVHFP